MSSEKKTISVIVPCYNEQESLPLFYNEVCKVADELYQYSFEMVFINDGSQDRTLEMLRDLSEKDKRVHYISFSRNFGKESAMLAGFSNACGEYITVMDADMQDPPYLLPQMLEVIESGAYDSVATKRATRDGEPLIRSFFARLFYKIINNISDVSIESGARDFRLMKKEMVDAIVSMGEYNRFSKGIFGWIGFRTYWIAYDNIERIAGETKWNFWKLFKYSIDGIINFSQVPLYLSSLLGILLTVLSVLASIVVVVRKLIWGDAVQGWASLACIIMFIGGMQLFCIGIVGQYLAKMYMEVKNRPHYIVQESDLKSIK